MPNQQLVEYINQCLAAGQTKEQIKQSLFSAGWQEADIDETLGGVSGTVAVPTMLLFPQEQAVSGQIKYAGFWIRYIAASIDGLVISIATLLLTIIGIILFIYDI